MFRLKSATTLIVSAATAAFLIGCGGGGDTATTSTTTTTTSSVPTGSYTVTVVDDAIVGATVTAPECATFTANGNGSYTLKECIAAPSTITAVGGFIDTDGNGAQGTDEASQTAPLLLKTSQSGATNNFTVTPLTTLASQESDLAALAAALGVSQTDLFTDSAANRGLMRAINAVLISAREAGITKYDDFVADLKDQIKAASGTTAIDRLTAAKAYMADPANLAAYKSKFGVVFGGFVDDTSALDLSTDPLKAVKTANTATAGKVRLGGFVYDAEIPSAAITIYDGTTVVGTGTSESTGRYQIEIDEDVLASSKVLRFEAVAGTTKLIAYLTTDELRTGKFGSKVSSGTVEDLIISNVTTAKAVMVDKLSPTANADAAEMVQTKTVVEAMYGQDVLAIASSIKAVVDYSAPLNGNSDTLALAQAVAAGSQDANQTYTSNIQNDPLLSGQLNSTASNVATATSMRTLMVGNTFYEFDYRSEFSSVNPFTYGTIAIKADGSDLFEEYKYDGQNWVVFQSDAVPAGTHLWSSDGNTLFSVGDAEAPVKHTVIAKEVVTTGMGAANIYIVRSEVTAEPTEGFYTRFETTADDEGTGSYDPATQLVTYQFPWDTSVQSFYLGTNGYIQWTSAAGTDTTYPYKIVSKYGRNFIVAQFNDSKPQIYYMANGKVYRKDYPAIGFTETSWFTDSVLLLGAYKNMPADQRFMLEQAMYAATSPVWSWEKIQAVFYTWIKSL